MTTLAFSTNWIYDKRETTSFTGAVSVLFLVAAIWIIPHDQESVTTTTEMLAFLEVTPAQAPEKVIEKPLEKKVDKVQSLIEPKSQKSISEKSVDAPSQIDLSMAKPSVALQSAVSYSADPANTSATNAKPMEQGVILGARYEALLRAYLEKIKRYPSSREARLAKPEGIVKVILELSRSGELLAVAVIQSSGFNLLDSEALKTIKSGSFPAFPEGAFAGESSHKFSANLKYTISDSAPF